MLYGFPYLERQPDVDPRRLYKPSSKAVCVVDTDLLPGALSLPFARPAILS
jgi:hypothetical protein